MRVPIGCGCDESECEYSRTRDSYALKVLCDLPVAYRPMPEPARDIVSCIGGPRVCPPCPPDNCVVLADITVTGREVRRIDCDKHRRYVVSFAGYYFLCRERDRAPGRLRRRYRSHWVRPGRGASLVTCVAVDPRASE